MNTDSLTDAEIEACDSLWCGVNGDDYHAFMDDIALVITKVKAEAWDDGYKCGGMDERHDWNGWEDPFENPYRDGDAA